MRTLTGKAKGKQSTNSLDSSSVYFQSRKHTHSADSILSLQPNIGIQDEQQVLQSDAEQSIAFSPASDTPRQRHDLTRIPISHTRSRVLQPKWTINKPGDKYEQEADQVAEQVMRMPEPKLQDRCLRAEGDLLCRTSRPCQKQDQLYMKQVQSGDEAGTTLGLMTAQLVDDALASSGQPLPPSSRAFFEPRFGHDLSTIRVHNERETVDTGWMAAPPIVQEVLAAPGQLLDPAIRAFMEPRFGHSFAAVRVHTDGRAAESAHAVGARAYTVGNHIVLGEKASMQSSTGQRLLAHELAHTIQQGDQSIPSEPIPIGTENSSTERQARAAERDTSPTLTPSSTRGPVVQRDVLGAVGEAITGPFENARNRVDLTLLPLAIIFDDVVISNIAVASAISVPENWRSTLLEYSIDNPLDGAVLIPAMARFPSFWRGGWIMSLQPEANAMTLDDDVFVSGRLDLPTFAHELVHVFQYTLLGKVAFLASYFGLSAATIANRWVTGQPLEPMRSSPHEEQAYNLVNRFISWYSTTKGVSASSVTV